MSIETCGHLTRCKLLAHDALAQRIEIDTASVVRDANTQLSRVMSRFDAQGCLRRLSACASFVWRLDAVIERVSKHVIQRCIKPRENVAIDRNVLADDLKFRILAECARDITYGPRKRCGHIGERPHAARKHFVIELR